MYVVAADWSSLTRYCFNRLCIGFHAFGLIKQGSIHTARLADGLQIAYRCDPGDVQSIREVLLQEVYRLPSDTRRKVIVDLGANIGLASMWLARTYSAERVIALEPDDANAELVRQNFVSNNIPGVLIQAAIGASDGTARFQPDFASNKGRLGPSGKEVSLLSMPSLLERIGVDGNVSLLKIDIEGTEEELLCRDLSWLRRIDEIIIEFHPTIVPYEKLIAVIVDAGFAYSQPQSGALAMDYFRRRET